MEQGELEERRRSQRRATCVALGMLVLLALGLVLVSSSYIHSYASEPIAIRGRLEEIESSRHALELVVDGRSYTLQTPRDRLDYGVLNGMPRNRLWDVLESYAGTKVFIEYVNLGVNDRLQHIVGLWVDGGIEIINHDAAVHDLIEYENTGRLVWGGVGIVALALLLLVWKRIIEIVG